MREGRTLLCSPATRRLWLSDVVKPEGTQPWHGAWYLPLSASISFPVCQVGSVVYLHHFSTPWFTTQSTSLKNLSIQWVGKNHNRVSQNQPNRANTGITHFPTAAGPPLYILCYLLILNVPEKFRNGKSAHLGLTSKDWAKAVLVLQPPSWTVISSIILP